MSKMLSRNEISNLVAEIKSRNQIEKSALEEKAGHSIGEIEVESLFDGDSFEDVENEEYSARIFDSNGNEIASVDAFSDLDTVVAEVIEILAENSGATATFEIVQSVIKFQEFATMSLNRDE